MKTCIQRVLNANLVIDNKEIANINKGLVVFVGFTNEDTEEKIDYFVRKISGLRIFEDVNGKMNLSTAAVDGEFLIIPNFTLYANCAHGFRPDFINALKPTESSPLFDSFVNKMKDINNRVKCGVFGADMKITQTNDGPITIIIEK